MRRGQRRMWLLTKDGATRSLEVRLWSASVVILTKDVATRSLEVRLWSASVVILTKDVATL
jgi:hypothetical protein